MSRTSRRDFLKSVAGTAGVLAAGGTLDATPRKSASDWIPLGNSGVQVTRLAFGTGTFGGKVQRDLGQEQFTRLVRHAYDRGIRFFETADAYTGMHQMLGEALKGIPRDSYRLMTKFRWRQADDPGGTIDRFRRELNSEYFDILLIHCVRTSGWSDDLKRLRDHFSEAKQKKIILAHGASCHGILPLREFPGNRWLDVALLRVNHNGTRMDNLQGEDKGEGNVPEALAHIKSVHAQGTGVIGMKIMGEGAFRTPELREESIRFVTKLGAVQSMTIGFKSPAEIDEAIERLNRNLNA
jgi:predicted aldo/keto reductase-like oxidoreductase